MKNMQKKVNKTSQKLKPVQWEKQKCQCVIPKCDNARFWTCRIKQPTDNITNTDATKIYLKYRLEVKTPANAEN